MLIRNPWLQRLVAALLVALVAVSAQAWASHVDWPATQAGEHVHVDVSALDEVQQSPDKNRSVEADHSDHCCHAAAHLVGLRSHAQGMNLKGQMQPRGNYSSRYASIAHPPLMIPPIV